MTTTKTSSAAAPTLGPTGQNLPRCANTPRCKIFVRELGEKCPVCKKIEARAARVAEQRARTEAERLEHQALIAADREAMAQEMQRLRAAAEQREETAQRAANARRPQNPKDSRPRFVVVAPKVQTQQQAKPPQAATPPKAALAKVFDPLAEAKAAVNTAKVSRYEANLRNATRTERQFLDAAVSVAEERLRQLTAALLTERFKGKRAAG